MKLEPEAIIMEWRACRYDYQQREMFLDRMTELIEAYFYSLDEAYAPATRKAMVMPVISYFKKNRVPVDPEISEPIYVKYHNRDISREEIQRILEHASLRDRAFFLVMAESGQRPYTLVQTRMVHIREEFEAAKIPMKIDLPAELIKDRVGHRWTFIGEDGFNTLKEYLSARMPLEDEDLLFAPDKPHRMKGKFLSPTTFGNAFSKIVLKLGLAKRVETGKPKGLRLYCLRKYFRNQIRVSDTAYREFWMGHTFGTDEHYLTRNVEEHRKAYEKAYPSIRILQTSLPETLETLKTFYEEKLKTQRQEILNEIHDSLNAEWNSLLATLEDILPPEHKDKIRQARERQYREQMKARKQ